jgi:hypothetical protein
MLELPLVEVSGEMGMVLSGTGSLPLMEVVIMADVVEAGRDFGWSRRDEMGIREVGRDGGPRFGGADREESGKGGLAIQGRERAIWREVEFVVMATLAESKWKSQILLVPLSLLK